MHTFVYQFERFVIDHYERISLYTEIRLHVYHFYGPNQAASFNGMIKSNYTRG